MQFGPKHLRADANPFHATPLALCGARPKKGFPSHSHEYFQKMGKQHRSLNVNGAIFMLEITSRMSTDTFKRAVLTTLTLMLLKLPEEEIALGSQK